MQKKKEDLAYSFISFTGSGLPRYFELKKSFLNFLFLIMPFVTVITVLFAIFSFSYALKVKNASEELNPRALQESIDALKEENALLETQVLESQEDLKLVQEKLNAPPDNKRSSFSQFNLFGEIRGRQDLSFQKQIETEDLRIDVQNSKLTITLQLVNTIPDSRVSGYVFILMQNESHLSTYPAGLISQERPFMNFQKGESVTFARLRPVKAEFQVLPSQSPIFFRLIVFSRAGDILYMQTFNADPT